VPENQCVREGTALLALMALLTGASIDHNALQLHNTCLYGTNGFIVGNVLNPYWSRMASSLQMNIHRYAM